MPAVIVLVADIEPRDLRTSRPSPARSNDRSLAATSPSTTLKKPVRALARPRPIVAAEFRPSLKQAGAAGWRRPRRADAEPVADLDRVLLQAFGREIFAEHAHGISTSARAATGVVLGRID
jgi:hypothetical protein